MSSQTKKQSPFHAYDIRGLWERELDADMVYRIGRCVPALLGANTVLVGRDARSSSPIAFEVLVRGICEAGADVHDMGLCTTPMTYYFTGAKGYKAAIMITASHNPKEYNGLKFSRFSALPVGFDSGLAQLEKMIGEELPPKATVAGKVVKQDVLDEYIAYHRRFVPDFSNLKIVVDCSNGVGALVARRLFAGNNVEFINEDLDGSFPNHPPNPLLREATEQLSEAVRAHGADLGIIFDGDADRVAFVDERGEFVRPDVMTAVLGEYYLSKEPGKPVLCDIRTSRGVTDRVSALGGEPHLWKVGHAFAKVKLRELGAIVGGELAGHYYFRDFYGCDSAMLCASIVLARAAQAKSDGESFSELISQIDVYANSGECNYEVEDKDAAIERLREWVATGPAPERTLDFDGLRWEWKDWWFNVRKSNTEPYLRLLVEARTPADLATKKAQIEKIILDK